MQQARKTDLTLFIKLLKGHRPFGMLGLAFTGLGLFVMLPLIVVISASITEPYQNYDIDAILNHGTNYEAIITDKHVLGNVSINNESPVEFSYTYTTGGKVVHDKLQTMDLEKAQAIAIGSSVKIKAYNGESVITGLKSFSFPIQYLFMLPGTFFILGSVFLTINLIPALKNFRLYKNGTVRDATLITLYPYSYSMSYRNVQKVIKVEYSFTGRTGQKMFGDSVTNDFLFYNERRAGDTINIFTDPEDESKNTIVPRPESIRYNWNIWPENNA